MSRITSAELNVPYFDKPKKIWVFLPENYDAGEKFSVIYMQDGQDVFYDNLADRRVSWRAAETMDELYHNDGISAILVAVESADREKEFSPWSANRKEILFPTKKGKEEAVNFGEEYADFLAKILKPYIDKNFKTDGSAENTAVIGAGLGALASVFVGMKYNFLFGNIGAFSINARGSEKKFIKFANEIELSRVPSFYIYCGGSEGETAEEKNLHLRTAYSLAQISSDRGARVRLILDAQGINHESRWGEEFGGFVKYFIGQSRQN